MKLRKECLHGKFEAHEIIGKARPSDVYRSDLGWCDGGVFLPDDTLIIEKENGEWPGWVVETLADISIIAKPSFRVQIQQNLDALSVREAE